MNIGLFVPGKRKSLDAKPRPPQPLKGRLIFERCGIARAMPRHEAHSHVYNDAAFAKFAF
jgi:hypothetical protein